MEFNFSRFFTAVSIDVFDSVNIRDVFDDRDNSFKVISFNKVNDFLSKEFRKSFITLFSEFRIFIKVFLHLFGKQVNQMFGSSILNRNLNYFFFVVNHVGNTVDDGNI